MKKILVVLFLGLLVSSCSLFESEDVRNAKMDLGVIDSNEIDSAKSDLLNGDDNSEVKTLDVDKSSFETKSLTEKEFLKLDDLDSKISDLGNSVKITGKAIGNVDKIIVYFSNKDSNFVNDKFTLKKFKAGGSTFEYNALVKYENLDFGANKYIFEAHSGDEVSKLELTIYKINPEDNKDSKEDFVLDSEDKKVELGDFPSNGKFGNPVNMGKGAITYSDIKGLEIKKENFDKSLLNSENIWREDGEDYLSKNIGGYVYWNTLRPIDANNKNLGVSFYILRKSGDKFLYEKLYFDFTKGYKGTLFIEEYDKQTDNVSTEMNELNKSLKDKNSSYEKVKITDELFKNLLNK